MSTYYSRVFTFTSGSDLYYSVVNNTDGVDAAAVLGEAPDAGLYAISVQGNGSLDNIYIYSPVAGGAAVPWNAADGAEMPASDSWRQYVRRLPAGWDVLIVDSGGLGTHRVEIERIDSATTTPVAAP